MTIINQPDPNFFQCVSYSFVKRFIRYYFVFKNDSLTYILEPDKFFEWKTEADTGETNRIVEVQKKWDSEERMQDILNCKTMSVRMFVSELKKKIEDAREHKESFNVLPAFVILAPLVLPDLIAQNKKQEEWSYRYDPFKIRIGSKLDEVKAIYGKPHFVVHHGDINRLTYAYGPSEVLFGDKKHLYLGPLNKVYWTAVVYDNNSAVRIFSNDLFNDDDIVSLENEVR